MRPKKHAEQEEADKLERVHEEIVKSRYLTFPTLVAAVVIARPLQQITFKGKRYYASAHKREDPVAQFKHPEEAEATLRDVVRVYRLLNARRLTVTRVRPPVGVDVRGKVEHHNRDREHWEARLYAARTELVLRTTIQLGIPEDDLSQDHKYEGTEKYFLFFFWP